MIRALPCACVFIESGYYEITATVELDLLTGRAEIFPAWTETLYAIDLEIEKFNYFINE